MWMHGLIDRVRAHLDVLGVRHELTLHQPLAGDEAIQARDATDVPWPESLWEILTEYANGFAFRWPADEIDAEPFCEIELPGWREIHQARLDWLDFLDHLDDEFFSRAGDPELAKMHAVLGRSWFPVLTEANGDQIVVDARTGQVRLHHHDWCDGGSGDDGFFVAESLQRFFEYWSWCSFTQPLSTLDTVLTPYGVNWECPPEYRLWN